jgi:hypothetical protein
MFRIKRQRGALELPRAQIGPRTRRFGDLDVVRPAIGNPPIPRERQRRPLDPPSQQAACQTPVETAQPIDIYRPVIYPIELYQRPMAKCPQSEKGGLVHMRKSIVHRLNGSLFPVRRTRRCA